MLARVATPLTRRAVLLHQQPAMRLTLVRAMSGAAWDPTTNASTSLPRKPRVVDQYSSPADAPLKSTAKDAASDVKRAALDAASEVGLAMSGLSANVKGKAKRAANKLASSIESATSDPQHRALHTSAAPRAIDDNSDMQDLKDDARRMKDKASNRLSQAGIEIKEKSQEMMHGAKKVGRRIKKAVAGAVDDVSSAPSSSSSSMSSSSSSGGASDVIGPEARWSESEPVRAAAHSEVLSTSRAGSAGIGALEPDVVEEPVKKSSLWDGPQEMPQGVGKRAKNEKGQPMETGTERS